MEHPETCDNCGHKSDCSTHNEPAMANEPCDCAEEKMAADETIDEALYRRVYGAVGEASMCWTDFPSGVFDSTRANRVADDLIAFIKPLLAPPVPFGGWRSE